MIELLGLGLNRHTEEVMGETVVGIKGWHGQQEEFMSLIVNAWKLSGSVSQARLSLYPERV